MSRGANPLSSGQALCQRSPGGCKDRETRAQSKVTPIRPLPSLLMLSVPLQPPLSPELNAQAAQIPRANCLGQNQDRTAQHSLFSQPARLEHVLHVEKLDSQQLERKGHKESVNRAWSSPKQVCPISCAAEVVAAPQLLLSCFRSVYITQGKASTTTIMCSRR